MKDIWKYSIRSNAVYLRYVIMQQNNVASEEDRINTIPIPLDSTSINTINFQLTNFVMYKRFFYVLIRHEGQSLNANAPFGVLRYVIDILLTQYLKDWRSGEVDIACVVFCFERGTSGVIIQVCPKIKHENIYWSLTAPLLHRDGSLTERTESSMGRMGLLWIQSRRFCACVSCFHRCSHLRNIKDIRTTGLEVFSS